MAAERIPVLGVGVDPVNLGGATRRVERFLAEGTFRHVVTVNPEFVMTARAQPEFAAVLNRADLALADGIGILLAARLAGDRIPERITGADFVPVVAGLCADRGRGVFLLGAAPGVAERAAASLAQATGCAIAGTFAGSPAPAAAEEILDRLRTGAAGAVFVAFGSPAQDLWIHRYRDALPPAVMMGVGGTFDFLAGTLPRAPGTLRRLGLEWLWRLAVQPWRWRRQLALPRFALAVVAERLSQISRRGSRV